MPRRRKLTIEQVDRVRAVHAARKRLLAALAQLPTLEALAAELGVSTSSLKMIVTARTYRGSTRNTLVG